MRRISPATVTVGVLAIVCGLVAAYVVRQSMLPKPVAQPEPVPAPTKAIVIARVNLPVNSVVRTQDLQTLRVPADREIEAGYIKRPEVAVGRVVKSTLKAGQLVREEYLMEIGESLPSVADRLPPGHRALTIHVNRSNGNGPMIEAGAHVDIAMSVEGTHPDLGELATRTLLRGVPVVDVSAASRRGAEAIALTVAVTPQDANKLITAEQTGMLNVTLCSSSDGDDPLLQDDTDSITRRDLLGLSELPQPADPPVVPTAKPFKVEQWRGSKLDTIEFGQSAIEEAQRSGRPATTAGSPARSPFTVSN